MTIKPQDFFIGVIDFFSVILPGVLVTYFLISLPASKLIGVDDIIILPKTKTQQWLAFLFVAYIIGHIIFLIASLLLDKLIYDKFLRNKVFKKNYDLSYHAATSIREQYLSSKTLVNAVINSDKLNEKETEELLKKDKWEIINTFKWAKNYLAAKFPETMTDINKIEADSKFFRSLVIAFLFIAVVLFFDNWKIGSIFMALSILSLYRFGELRYRTTQNTYDLIITLDHMDKQTSLDVNEQPLDNRLNYLMPDSEIEPYQDKITEIIKGPRLTSEVISIPMGKTWKVTNCPGLETIYCLSGRCVAKNVNDKAANESIDLSENAIFKIIPKSSIEIANKQEEPLVLLVCR